MIKSEQLSFVFVKMYLARVRLLDNQLVLRLLDGLLLDRRSGRCGCGGF